MKTNEPETKLEKQEVQAEAEKLNKWAYYSYISRYFLFMAEQEIKFAMPDIKDPELKNRYKLLLQKINQIDEYFLRKNVNIKEVFNDFKEEKINAIHATLAYMINLDETECLEVETYLENKVK
jgi:hypothetical protein